MTTPALPKSEPVSGFFLVDKPIGPSSAAVTNRLKWLLKPSQGKNVKIGHGGTLDPLACGLLPIGLGKGTKSLQTLLDGPKTYRFTVAFGAATTTQDAEGEVCQTSPVRPTQAQIHAVLPRFIGDILQTPPAYSALKVGGQRAYARARAGEDVALPPRPVTIHSLTLEETTPQNAARTATFTAQVGKGTYIRTLAADMAAALGTVGHTVFLQRTTHGPFTLEQAVSFQKLDTALQTGDWQQHLLPLAACLGEGA